MDSDHANFLFGKKSYQHLHERHKIFHIVIILIHNKSRLLTIMKMPQTKYGFSQKNFPGNILQLYRKLSLRFVYMEEVSRAKGS